MTSKKQMAINAVFLIRLHWDYVDKSMQWFAMFECGKLDQWF